MSQKKLKATIGIYILGIILAIIAITFYNSFNIHATLLLSILLAPSWIVSLADYAKTNQQSTLRLILLILIPTIFIPIYLVQELKYELKN